MIVCETAQGLELVTQPDHAFFAAELLALWRTQGLASHPRRADLLFAVREHDNGWREADAAPRAEPGSGRPASFLTIPETLRAEIWLRGTERFAARRPYAALLVAQHGLALHAGKPTPEPAAEPASGPVAELVEALASRRLELLEESGVSPEALRRDYRFLELVDLVSLVVCNRWQRPFALGHWRFALEGEAGDALGIDPFPLVGPTTFSIRCRRIPDRPYSGDADLGGELAAARWQQRPIQVRTLG